MSDLIEFLDARISEDEAAARAASSGPWQWSGDPEDNSAVLYASDERQVLDVYAEHGPGYLAVAEADRVHITIHDPVRVLAECAAKRKILENVPPVADPYDRTGEASPYVLMCLASVYRRHPDYQEGWAVDGL
jgi:hypothetical protein